MLGFQELKARLTQISCLAKFSSAQDAFFVFHDFSKEEVYKSSLKKKTYVFTYGKTLEIFFLVYLSNLFLNKL